MASSVAISGAERTVVPLTFDSNSNFSVARQLAAQINADVASGALFPTYDDVPPPTIPAGAAGGFYQTLSGSGGVPPGYTVDIVKVPGNAFVVSSGLPGQIILSDAETNLQFVAQGSAGSGTVVGGGGISTFTIAPENTGNWYLASGAGDDLIVATGSGSNTINAGAGTNTIILGPGANSVLSSGNDVIYGALDATTGVDTINALTAESTIVRGNNADIYFIGGSGGATLIGGSGSDTYFGAASSGPQYIRGGSAGNNYLQAAAGEATLFGGGDGDRLLARGSVSQTLVAGTGNETLSALAGTGADSLVAGSGRTLLVGGTGADTFVGGSGSSTIQPLASDSTFEFIRGSAGGDAVVQDITDPQSIKIELTNYQNRESAYALNHQQVAGNSLVVRLSDGTRITFEDVNQKLTDRNFT